MMGVRGSISIVLAVTAILAGLFLPRIEAALVRDADGCPHSGAVAAREHIDQGRAAILCLLNQERARRGLRPLRRNRALQLASQRHSEDMAARDFFAHEAPGGTNLASRTRAAGYPHVGVVVGENIYWGQEAKATPVEAVDGWMHSSGHRENILRPQFTEVGVGIAHEAPVPVTQHRSAIYTTDFGGPVLP
jgi:uncharacterized protein YkwD